MAEHHQQREQEQDKTPTPTPPDVVLPARPYGFPPEAFDFSRLPDVDTNFLPADHLEAFIQALSAPDPVRTPGDTQLNSPSSLRRGSTSSSFFDILRRDDTPSTTAEPAPQNDTPQAAAAAAADALSAPAPGAPTRSNSNGSMFITAQSDWAPVHEKVLGSNTTTTKRRRYRFTSGEKKKPRRGPPAPSPLEGLIGSRSKDETREGYLYSLLKWPFLLIVGAWITGLGVAYLATRFYVYLYEQGVAWRGQRERLRRAMRATGSYAEWVPAAKRMDAFLGDAKRWREEDEFAYYDSQTVRRVWEQMRRCRGRAERAEEGGGGGGGKDVEDLKGLVEACVKNNWVGIENPRLYSQTYYGTKNLVQNYVDEGRCSSAGGGNGC